MEEEMEKNGKKGRKKGRKMAAYRVSDCAKWRKEGEGG